jgi:hypothetical protein
MNVLAGLLIFWIFQNFGMYFIFKTYWGNEKIVNFSNFYFWSTTPAHQLESFCFYKPARLAGLAGHTSSTVYSELLPVLDNTMYMIVTCTQSPFNVSVGF